MQIKARKISDTEAEFTATNTAQEVEQFYQSAYNQLKKRVNVPGFRKGRVPQELVERQLGNSILEQTINDLINHVIHEHTPQLDPKPVSMLDVEVKSFARGKGATFVGKYEILAPIQLASFQKVEMIEDILYVDEKGLNAELEKIRQTKALVYTRETAAEASDVAEIEITIRHKSETLVKKQSGILNLADPQSLLPGLTAQVIAMRPGEEKSFVLDVPIDHKEGPYAGKKLDIRLKLLDCRYVELPDLDDDFARDQGGFANLEAYKQKIKNDLLEKGRTILQDETKNLLLAKIAENTKCHLPEAVVERAAKQRQHEISHELGRARGKKHLHMEEIARLMGKDSNEIEKEIRSSCEASLRHYLVLQELVKVFDKKVSEAEFKATVQLEYAPEMAKRLLTTTEVSKSEELQGITEKLRLRLLHKTALEHLYSISKIEPGKEISWSDLVEMKTNETKHFSSYS